MPVPEGSSPPWTAGLPSPDHPPLLASVEADVAVVGAGIAGLTGAYFLARSGKSVVVLERDTVAGAETGRTTGFLTEVLDARLVDLVAIHGEEGARAAWVSSRKGLELIDSIVHEAAIDCEFKRVAAFLFGPRAMDVDLLRREARCARELGFAVDLVDPGDIPFRCRTALRIPDQARIHPRKYMLGLAKAILARGGQIYERTNVTKLGLRKAGRHDVELRTDRGKAGVRTESVLLASNAPFVDPREMYSRLRPCRSYAMSARIPRGGMPEGLFWNTLDPYDYARVDAGPASDLLILGGADHPVGQVGQPDLARAKIRRYWARVAGQPPSDPTYWSGQILNSEDGLPFIGINPRSRTGEMIGTGFGGNGLTLGTLTGWMFSERVAGRPTPWDSVYDPNRKRASTSGTSLEAVPQAAPRRKTRTVRNLRDLAVGTGAWYRDRRRRVAVFRDEDRELQAVDARCTHLGCFVEWNRIERSWDCPCHGSRFDVSGKVLDGPAFRPLESVALSERRTRSLPPREKREARGRYRG
jgi:glycine/D-amino acid oxidase-like deaminating enzyme/nitrite reductase/ring-hydroxylating ferredoxin subunit